MTVAPFADLYVGIMLRSRDASLSTALFNLSLSKVGQQLHVVKLAVIAVHLWNFALQILQIALRKTPHNIELSDTSLLLGLHKFKYHVDAFLLGIGNETTRIHHDYLPLRVFCVVAALIAIGFQLPNEQLTVHKVL